LLACKLCIQYFCLEADFASLAEILLHHTAVAVQGLSHREGLLAEHLLSGTNTISKRIELQLATEPEQTLGHIIRSTQARIMKHLCLQVDPNIAWQKTPESVRRAIVARILGDTVEIDSDMEYWSNSVGLNISTVDFSLSLCLNIYEIGKKRQRRTMANFTSAAPGFLQVPPELTCAIPKIRPSKVSAALLWLKESSRIAVVTVKWIAILTGAASEVERELWYSLRGIYFRDTVLRMLLAFWKVCWVIRNVWIRVFLIYHRPILRKIRTMAHRGVSRTLVRNIITVELPGKTITGFGSRIATGSISLDIYDGALEEPPSKTKPVTKATYDEHNRLRTRIDNLSSGEVISTFEYGPAIKQRWPTSKITVEPLRTVRCQYDQFGRVVNGNIEMGTKEFEFEYHYRKQPKHNSDIARADYRQSNLPDRSLWVFWSFPLPGQSDSTMFDSVPSERVTRVVRNIDGQKYTTM
jgi:hypothetical protein